MNETKKSGAYISRNTYNSKWNKQFKIENNVK